MTWATGSLMARRRRAVIARDGLTCRWCGIICTDEKGSGRQSPTKATVDHVLSRRRGGTHDLSNLVIACHDCNQRRGREDWSAPPHLDAPPAAR